MSADNGIYIAEFPEGWRVIHTQAIGNLDYYPRESKKWWEVLISYYGDSPLFSSKEEAWKKAMEMEEDILSDDFCPILEYGISILGKFPSIEHLIKEK